MNEQIIKFEEKTLQIGVVLKINQIPFALLFSLEIFRKQGLDKIISHTFVEECLYHCLEVLQSFELQFLPKRYYTMSSRLK